MPKIIIKVSTLAIFLGLKIVSGHLFVFSFISRDH